MVTLIRVSNAIIIHQSACIDIQLQRESIRLDVKLQLFDKLGRRTLPSRIVRIDEIADSFKHRIVVFRNVSL